MQRLSAGGLSLGAALRLGLKILYGEKYVNNLDGTYS